VADGLRIRCGGVAVGTGPSRLGINKNARATEWLAWWGAGSYAMTAREKHRRCEESACYGIGWDAGLKPGAYSVGHYGA